MGTVDHEKVLVGNLPSKSLYEYCFHPDQQCWKVSICLLLSRCQLAGPPVVASSASNQHPAIVTTTDVQAFLIMPAQLNDNCVCVLCMCGGLLMFCYVLLLQRMAYETSKQVSCHFVVKHCVCCPADLEQPGQGLHTSSRWHVLQDFGAHRGRGAFNMAAQHHRWGRQALPFCGRVWNSQDGYHSALSWHLDCQQQHCAEHELF